MGILNCVAVDDFVSSSLLVTNQFDVTSNLISPAINKSFMSKSGRRPTSYHNSLARNVGSVIRAQERSHATNIAGSPDPVDKKRCRI